MIFDRETYLQNHNHIGFIQEYIKNIKFRLYNQRHVHVINRKDLYLLYKDWCENNKHTPLKTSIFYHFVETDNNGIKTVVHRGYRVYSFDKNKIDEYMNDILA